MAFDAAGQPYGGAANRTQVTGENKSARRESAQCSELTQGSAAAHLALGNSRQVNRALVEAPALVETTCTGRTRRRKRQTSSARWRTDFQGRPATSILATPDGHYFSPKQISLVRVRTNSRPSAMAGVATILSSRRFLASTLSCSSAASTITVPFSPAT